MKKEKCLFEQNRQLKRKKWSIKTKSQFGEENKSSQPDSKMSSSLKNNLQM